MWKKSVSSVCVSTEVRYLQEIVNIRDPLVWNLENVLKHTQQIFKHEWPDECFTEFKFDKIVHCFFFWNQLWLTYFCNRNQFFIGCTFSLHQAEVNFLYGYGKLYFFYVGFLMTIMILICNVFVQILKSMSSIYVLKIK